MSEELLSAGVVAEQLRDAAVDAADLTLVVSPVAEVRAAQRVESRWLRMAGDPMLAREARAYTAEVLLQAGVGDEDFADGGAGGP